jgi:hypothetical protein
MDEASTYYEGLRQENEQKRARYPDYISFFEQHLPSAKRCLLSDEYKVFENGSWQPAASKLAILASFASDSGFYKRSHLPDHFARFVNSKQPELLVEIPEWDGVDRIKQFAQVVQLNNCSQTDFEELIKEWGSLLFERINDPCIQNRIIVMKGGQGIGKDTFVKAMIGGLGPYTTNLSISRNEADNLAMLADHLVLNISEFDRTSRTDASLIKDWITRDEATFRRPYERSHRRYVVRTSFIATINIDEILRDHTGNRRFIIFDIERIDWNYPKDQSAQILAQFKSLSLLKHRAPEETQRVMKTYIETHTPDDPKDVILEVWDQRLENLEEDGLPDREGCFTASDVSFVIADLAKLFGYGPKTIFSILKSNGRSRKTTGGNIVYTRDRTPTQAKAPTGAKTTKVRPQSQQADIRFFPQNNPYSPVDEVDDRVDGK